jgi:hypothetical protein
MKIHCQLESAFGSQSKSVIMDRSITGFFLQVMARTLHLEALKRRLFSIVQWLMLDKDCCRYSLKLMHKSLWGCLRNEKQDDSDLLK